MTVAERFLNVSIIDFILSKLSDGEMKAFLSDNKRVINSYYMSLSSLKEVTAIVESLDNTQLGTLIASLYDAKWSQFYNILLSDLLEVDIYSPYHITESSTDNHTYSKDVQEDIEEDGQNVFEKTSTNTRNGSNSQVGEGTSDNNFNTYGFNSSTPVPVDDNTSTATNEITTTTQESDTSNENYTDSNDITKNRTVIEGGNSQDDGTKTIEGNIGNLTRDNISEGRIKLLKTNFINTVIYDINEVTTINYYGGF